MATDIQKEINERADTLLEVLGGRQQFVVCIHKGRGAGFIVELVANGASYLKEYDTAGNYVSPEYDDKWRSERNAFICAFLGVDSTNRSASIDSKKSTVSIGSAFLADALLKRFMQEEDPALVRKEIYIGPGGMVSLCNSM